MAQIKVFSSATTHGDLAALEGAVNAWLEGERPQIVHFAQTAFGADLILTFIYDSGADEDQAALAEAAEVPDVFEQDLDELELDPTSDTSLLPEAELPY